MNFVEPLTCLTIRSNYLDEKLFIVLFLIFNICIKRMLGVSNIIYGILKYVRCRVTLIHKYLFTKLLTVMLGFVSKSTKTYITWLKMVVREDTWTKNFFVYVLNPTEKGVLALSHVS